MVAPTYRTRGSSTIALRTSIVFLLLFLSYGGAARVVRFSLHHNVPTRVAVEVMHQSNSWCVARPDASESQLQDALDWACGDGTNLGNSDCTAIQSDGACYNPNSVASHASYAFNQYYQQENRQTGSCFFGGVAQITTQDPSSGSCIYPSSSSSLNSNITTTNPAFGGGGGGGSGSGTGSSIAPEMNIHFILTFLCLLLLMVVNSWI